MFFLAGCIATSMMCCLLDAVMPVAIGREAYERIRQRRLETAFLFAGGHSRDVLPAEFLAGSSAPG